MSKPTLAEKMARRICENDGHAWPAGARDPYNDRFQRKAYEKMARAALAVVLEEMREHLSAIDKPVYTSSWEEGVHDGVRAIRARLVLIEQEQAGG